MIERMDSDRAYELGAKLAGRKNMTDGELLDSFGDWQRARASEERLAEWARFVIRQGCRGNPKACAAEPCPACRAIADLRAGGLEVDL